MRPLCGWLGVRQIYGPRARFVNESGPVYLGLMNGSMSDPSGSLEQQRERAIAHLAEQFARDGLGIEELERRIDDVQRAQSADDVGQAIAGLPALPEPASVPAAPESDARGRRRSSFVVAVMGGTERRGGWTPGPEVFALALMGGVELDFRDARLAPGITDIHVVGIMGGVSIIVPPDLPIEMHGFPIMGGWDEPPDARHPARPGEPDEHRGEKRLLRVYGFALMGGVEVMVRLPGESERDAVRRRRGPRRIDGDRSR